MTTYFHKIERSGRPGPDAGRFVHHQPYRGVGWAALGLVWGFPLARFLTGPQLPPAPAVVRNVPSRPGPGNEVVVAGTGAQRVARAG